jgi:signal transduction histidine kinase/HAMP domain-containing protein
MTVQRRRFLLPWQFGLQGRLTFISLLFALVPLTAVSLLIFSQAQARLQDEIGSNVREIAAATGSGVESFFSTRLAEVKVMAKSSILTASDSTPEQKIAFLRTVQDAYGYYKSIDITDVNGQVIAASDQTSGDQSQRDWFQQGKAGKTFISDVYYLTSVQSYVTTLSSPIVTPQGQFLGVVAGHIDGQQLFDTVAARHIGTSGKIFIVNGAGRDVADKDYNSLFTDWSGLTAVQDGLTGHSGINTGNNVVSGEPTLFGYVPIKGTDNWIAVGELPFSEVNAPINALAERTAQAAGLAAIIVALITLVVTRNIVQPIRRLAQVATTIGEGNWDVEVPTVKSADEIGQLTSAFSAMSKELKTIYGTLEDRVRERTIELETVADVSRATSTVLDVEKLIQTVSDLTKTSFNLYHAHIYLLDETGKNLVLAAGAGTAGRTMKAEGRSIAINNEKSLVARAGRTRQGAIVNDVTQVSDFLPNPLLPNTKSEMAVPMVVAERLIGVLDVQSDKLDRFTEADVRVMTTLAAQVAVAVENARQYQSQVETAETLRDLDRLKSEFLANMSHELRTPLNSIIGYSQVMMDGLDGDLPAEAIEDVEAIHGSGKHLLSMINDILDLAKIEAGRMELDLERVSLPKVAEEVHSITNILLKETTVDLVVDIAPALPEVWGDPIRLRQILNNLIGNAVKFTREGEIRVRATCRDDLTNSITGEHGMIQIEVIDTGEGIAQDYVGLVFEQFRQVDNSSTRKAAGTGMGLAITRHLVELHGGNIWVNSKLGVGSTFTFTVPTAPVSVGAD